MSSDLDTAPPAGGPAPSGHQVMMVMVEDDPGHARLIERNVRRAGVCNAIRHFSDGSSALEWLFSDEPKGPMLLLLDLNLPDMSGVDILRRLRADARLRTVPVVVLTTTDDQHEIHRCYELGCNVYMTKPVNYTAFATAIRQLGLFLSVIQVPDHDARL